MGKNGKNIHGCGETLAELESMPAGYVPAPATAPRTVEPDRPTPLLVNATAPAVPAPAKTAEYSKIETAAMVGARDKTVIPVKPNPAQLQIIERGGESICARLGIKTETTDTAGAKISEIASASVADNVGLHVGDIINSVDGKAVGGPAELEAELQKRAPGTKIRIGYMFRSSARGALVYFSNEAILLLPRR